MADWMQELIALSIVATAAFTLAWRFVRAFMPVRALRVAGVAAGKGGCAFGCHCTIDSAPPRLVVENAPPAGEPNPRIAPTPATACSR